MYSPETKRLQLFCSHVVPLPVSSAFPRPELCWGNATPLKKVLIANRSVAAIRAARAAEELGLDTVAVFDPNEDDAALHTRLCTEAIPLENTGSKVPYLDAEALVAAALRVDADCIHPGYGFLAESADFARRCDSAGIVFIGPPAEALDIFGDKTRARELAASVQPPVPTLQGSKTAFFSAEDAYEFINEAKLTASAIMLKAARGGGGRGMRRIPAGTSKEDFVSLFKLAFSEAESSFGAGGIFVEELLENCRHIEVQVIASRQGEVAHLFERDCSVQLGKGSKIVEICPAGALPSHLRHRILEDAVRLVKATPGGYSNLGTVEFLVTESRHAFIEVNPRLQVEHGVTEEALGIDLVKAQFLLAAGVDISQSVGIPRTETRIHSSGLLDEPSSTSVEVRVCLTSPPQHAITNYREPGGRGVRLESSVQIGARLSAKYDPMIALIICTERSLEAALVRTARCVADFEIDGVSTNLKLLSDIIRSAELRDGRALTTTTSWTTVFQQRAARVRGPALNYTPVGPAAAPAFNMSEVSANSVTSPLAGLLRWEVPEGQLVQAGQTIAAVLAMKMETPVKAHEAGLVRFQAKDNEEVSAGQVVASLDSAVGHDVQADSEIQDEVAHVQEDKWERIIAERARRGALALQMGGEEALARKKKDGMLNIRERILATLDRGSFREVGPVAGGMTKDGIMNPANFVLGTGRIFDRPVIIGGEDFTIAGGSPNLGGIEKSVYTEKLALQLRIPLVRLHEGGGGAVVGGKKTGSLPKTKLSANPTSAQIVDSTRFGTVASCLGLVPVASAALGAVAGLPASRLVASHFVVAIQSSQILVAGPRVAEAAIGRRLSKQELGGNAVHEKSGVVDNYVSTEAEVFSQIRTFLSYLPSNVDSLPPFAASADPHDRCEADLLSIVPQDQTAYDMRKLIELVVDRDNPSVGMSTDTGSSFFEIGTCQFGQQIITGLARIGGYPVGIFANDPKHLNGAMTWQASAKTRRLIELCVTFHLPILTFVDQPGFMVGLEAEQAGTIRFGTSAVLAAQTAPVPWCSVQVRKCYGVAGAAHFGPNAHILLWPSAEQGTLPVEAGVAVMYRRQLEAAPPGERRKMERALIAEHSKSLNPWKQVESCAAQDLIDPRETRPRLCEWIELAQLRMAHLVGASTFPYRP